MKEKSKIKKEHIWLSCMVIGPMVGYASVFYPGMSVLAVIFLVIGIKGTIVDIM